MTAYDELMAFQRETEALAQVAGRLGWDQETVMPRGAAPQRGEEMAAMESVLHARRIDPRIADWLGRIETAGLDAVGQANLRHIKRDFDRATRVPADLAARIARVTSAAQGTWAEARAAEFRADHGIAGDAQVLAVLPGSRGGELDRLLPVFGDSLNRLWEGGWRGRVVVPTLARHLDRLRAAAQGWPGDPLVVAGNDEKWRAFAAADTALAASGTVTLELAAAGVPTVIAYKVSGVTAAIARRLIRTPHAGLVSILLGEEVMPEFIQDDCTPDRIVPALQALLGDKMARATQRGHFKQAMAMLQGPADGPAAAAADVVAGLINRT